MAEQEELAGADVEQARAGADASGLAVALALSRKGRGSRTDDRLDALLEKQSRMLDLQIENLEGDRALQHRHLALKYFGDRLRIGLLLLAVAFGLMVVISLAVMAWQAHEDHGLVIEAFSVPPSLASDGLTGEVVAARFLDKLKAMQTATQSERPAESFQNNWGSDIKLEIPQTGLTLGEFEKLLRDKLGHTSHVTGEVIRTPTGIALTARLGDAPPQTFSGAPGDFDALAEQAAESVYRTSQPYRFAQFLEQHGRLSEAIDVVSDLAANGPSSERAWAYSLWVSLDLEKGDLASARAHVDEGLAAGGPGTDFVEIYATTVELWSGHDERVLHYTERSARDAQTRQSQITSDASEETQLISNGFLAGLVGDFQESGRQYSLLSKATDTLGFAPPALVSSLMATDLALDHDPRSAMAASPPMATDGGLAMLQLEVADGFVAMPDYAIAADKGDWRAALAAMLATNALAEANKPAHPALGVMQPVWTQPLEALAMARTGDVAGAEALIATTPLDCYLCVRVRGQIAAVKQDWPSAEGWFGEAARQGPSIPFAFSDWGEMRLAKGDLSGAIAKFDLAHQKGPHFADPLKGWGDALARQGRWNDALAKYDEALKYAPAWLALQQAKEVAAHHPN